MGSVMKFRVSVRVNEKQDKVIVDGDRLVVCVKAPAERNLANRAVIALLEQHFNARVRIVSGFKKRNKVVEVYESAQ